MKRIAQAILIGAWLMFMAFTYHKEMWWALVIGTVVTFIFVNIFEESK